MKDLDSKILEELVYDRVRASVNLCQLVVLERELEESIERALITAVCPSGESAALAREYLDRAWHKVEREWRELREELTAAEEP